MEIFWATFKKKVLLIWFCIIEDQETDKLKDSQDNLYDRNFY